jgi:hypothetical protein
MRASRSGLRRPRLILGQADGLCNSGGEQLVGAVRPTEEMGGGNPSRQPPASIDRVGSDGMGKAR